jgi:uncharacterized protein (TIGR00106 family)
MNSLKVYRYNMENSEIIIMEFSMFPLDKGESLSKYVAKSIKIIKESGLDYKFGPMSTSIEGKYSDCYKVVNLCFETMKKECDRIVLNLKMDYRKDRVDGMNRKIKSVENRLK